MPDGSESCLTLMEVLHVPQLGRKLISMATATTNGAKGVICGKHVTLYNGNDVPILVAHMCGNLYKAEIVRIKGQSCSESHVSEIDNLTLIHERFGHVNKRTLVDTANRKNESVIGFSDPSLSLPKEGLVERIDCEACVLGKQARKHFICSNRSRVTTVGQRVHVDLCGPIGTETRYGCRYFVLFKD
jgi:hypothetical protein